MYRSTKSKNEVHRVILHVTFILLQHNRVSLFFINNGIQKNKDQHQGRCYLCIPWSNLNDDSAYLENCTIKISFVTQVLICSVAQSKKGGIRKNHTPNTLKPICYFIQCCLTYVCVGEYKSFRKYKKHPTFNIGQLSLYCFQEL